MKYVIGDKDYLIHHGIKGQKWGVENGPPYPLNAKDYSALEKKMNRLDKTSNVVNNRASVIKNYYKTSYGEKGSTTFVNDRLSWQRKDEDKFNKSLKDVKNYISKLKNSESYSNNKDAQKIFKQYEKSINELVKNTSLLPKAFYNQGTKVDRGMRTGAALFGVAGMGISQANVNGELTRMFEDPALLKEWNKYVNS